MPDTYDVQVTLVFKGRTADACLVSESLRVVERLIHASESRDLDAITASYKADIPKVAADAAKYRIKRLSGHSLVLKEAAPGSVILGGINGGLAVWVLSATLGESVKQAWLGSGLHERIKDFLLKRRREKVLDLEREIEDKLPRRLKRMRYLSTVVVSVRGNHPDYPSELYVEIEASHVTLSTPSLHEVLQEGNKTLIISSEHMRDMDL